LAETTMAWTRAGAALQRLDEAADGVIGMSERIGQVALGVPSASA